MERRMTGPGNPSDDPVRSSANSELTMPDAVAVVDAIPIPAFLITDDHTVLAYNNGLAELVGIDHEEARWTDCRETIAAAAYSDGRRSETLADKVAEAPRTADEEFGVGRLSKERDGARPVYEDQSTLHNCRGEKIPIRFLATPIFEDDELVGVLEVVEDSNPDYEEFPGLASLISHDVRNPLNVLKLEVETIREDIDESHHDTLVHSIERIEDIVEGISTFVSAADTGLETERLDVATVATVAWGTIDAPAARLETESVSVAADESLLAELFENLFENAITHGGEDVTVRVGPTDEGFYVEDTGTGIDPAERDRVFEHGYSTAADGTGFGLPIVHTIAANHDWTLEVTESDEGGARFEFHT